MTTPKRITRFVVETERTFIFRSRDGSRAMWCAGCGAQTEVATVAGAAGVAGLGEMEVYRLVAAGTVYFAEDEAGRVLVCLDSLVKRAEHERRTS